MNEKNIKKLQEMIKMVNEGLTKEDFVKSFEALVKVVRQLETDLTEKYSETNQTLNKETKKLLEKAESTLDKLEQQLNTKVNKALKEQENGLNFIRDKVRNLKSGEDGQDGKDADEPKIVSEVLSKIELPEELTAEELRDKLEDLKGEERLNVSAIDGLEEKLKKIEKTKSTGGGGIVNKNIFKDLDISDQLDGSSKTFNIQSVWNIISVDLSSHPYGALRKNVDFTYTSTSITFTDQIDAATQLNTGQSCVLTIVTSA